MFNTFLCIEIESEITVDYKTKVVNQSDVLVCSFNLSDKVPHWGTFLLSTIITDRLIIVCKTSCKIKKDVFSIALRSRQRVILEGISTNALFI